MNKKRYYFLCGLAMGTADTIPGISGGTIAFITGIYEQLLNSIKSFDKQFFKLFFTCEFKAALRQIPWNFLLPLIFGIGIAIFSLANIVAYLMENHISFVWSFFFGLIFASLYLIVKSLLKADGCIICSALLFILGTIFSMWIMFFDPISLPHTYLVIFFSGAIAICAMILPGISGAFILVLLGQYQYILQAVVKFDLSVIFIFGLGVICGLLSFTHLVSACLTRYYKASLAFLSGILAGSLVALFPFSDKAFHFNLESMLLCTLILIGIAIPFVLNKIKDKM